MAHGAEERCHVSRQFSQVQSLSESHKTQAGSEGYSSLAARLSRGASRKGKAIVICAESGMGKTYLMNELLAGEEKAGALVRRLNFSTNSHDVAQDVPSRLFRASREVISHYDGHSRLAISIDNIPPADECDVAREARALRRIATTGCLLVVCLRPECAQLAEELSEMILVSTSDLLYPPELFYGATGRQLWNLSYGVPLLVHAARRGSDEYGLASKPTSAYLSALASMTKRLIRSSLSNEENELRLGMILLGLGTLRDLRQVCHRLDACEMGELASSAPFFGINMMSGTFSVAGLANVELMRHCVRDCRAILTSNEKLALACFELLCEKKDFRRGAIIAECCRMSQGLALTICCHAFEFANAGAAGLLREALTFLQKNEIAVSSEAFLAASCLAELAGSANELSKLRKSCSDLPRATDLDRERRSVGLLGFSRNISLGYPGEAEQEIDDSELDEALLTHIRARMMLAEGRFCETFSLLVNCPWRHEPDTLIGALLSDDYEIATALMGEELSPEDYQDAQMAEMVLESIGSERLSTYRDLMEQALKVLAGYGVELQGVERAISKAHRLRDCLVEAIFLICAALSDLRRKAYSRAFIRVRMARDIAQACKATYFEEVASLLLAATGILLDDASASESLLLLCCRDSSIADLARFVQASQSEPSSEVLFAHLSRNTCSKDIGWLVRVLGNDFGSLSECLLMRMPQPWREMVRTYQMAEPEVNKGAGPAQDSRLWLLPTKEASAKKKDDREGLQDTASKSGDSGLRVRICILGRFRVEVDGREIELHQLNRRKARTLLELLASSTSHRMRKYEAIEALWDEVGFEVGLQRLYEATAILRKALGSAKGINPIISSRADGTISLNMSVVACDVDDFSRRARLALESEGSDHRLIQHVVTAAELYGGGMDLSSTDIKGICSERALALRGLYVDTLAAGCRAAMRLGRHHLACRLARRAWDEDVTREDVLVSLIESLKTMGRRSEVEALYGEYCRHLTGLGKLCASPALRRAVKEALGGSDNLGGPDVVAL